MEKRPSSSLVAERASPVASLRAEIFALKAPAPEGSRTVPLSVPAHDAAEMAQNSARAGRIGIVRHIFWLVEYGRGRARCAIGACMRSALHIWVRTLDFL